MTKESDHTQCKLSSNDLRHHTTQSRRRKSVVAAAAYLSTHLTRAWLNVDRNCYSQQQARHNTYRPFCIANDSQQYWTVDDSCLHVTALPSAPDNSIIGHTHGTQNDVLCSDNHFS